MIASLTSGNGLKSTRADRDTSSFRLSSRRSILPLFLCAAALGLVSASPYVKPDDLIRDANQAIEKEEFEKALQLFQDAEERGTDPGLIAFNKAAVFWHLGDFRKAELHYRMALNDGAAPVERRARSFFNLANCLVKQSDDRNIQLLRDSIRYYEACIDLTTDSEFANLARHDLEIAKLLWINARSRSSNPPSPNSDEPPDTPRQSEPKKKSDPEKKNEPVKSDDGKNSKKEADPKAKIDKGTEIPETKKDPNRSDAPQAGPGRVPVIPDSDQVKAQPRQDTLDALKFAEKRLNTIRQRLRQSATIPEKPTGRDW